jgi:hypothetical protein
VKKLQQAVSVKDAARSIEPGPEVRHLREQATVLQAENRKLKNAIGETRELFRGLAENIKSIEPPKSVYVPSASSKVSSPCSAVWHWTDWHIGEVVQPDEVEGFNAFNLDVAEGRVQRFVANSTRWIEMHKPTYDIPVLRIIDTGDSVSGDIHDELSRTNEFPVPRQVVEAARIKADAIVQASASFAQVVVDFVTADNHSRTTKKPQFKEGGTNSMNYLVGWITQKLVEKVKNVTFNLHPVISTVIDVEGWRYLIQHGHTIKGWSGIPYYGVERAVGREAKVRMNMAQSRRFHQIVMGHFHAPLNHPNFMIGGSLTGTNELDHGVGRFAPPMQTAWIVHPRIGELDYNKFNLAESEA